MAFSNRVKETKEIILFKKKKQHKQIAGLCDDFKPQHKTVREHTQNNYF